MEITGNVEEGTNPDRGVDNVELLCLEMSALFQDVAHQTNTLVHRDVRYGHMCKKMHPTRLSITFFHLLLTTRYHKLPPNLS